MQRSPSTSTTPSCVRYDAPTGQTCTQGVSLQWLHIFGTKNDFVGANGVWTGGNPSSPPFGESTCDASGDTTYRSTQVRKKPSGTSFSALQARDARAAADALLGVDEVRPPVLRPVVALRRPLLAERRARRRGTRAPRRPGGARRRETPGGRPAPAPERGDVALRVSSMGPPARASGRAGRGTRCRPSPPRRPGAGRGRSAGTRRGDLDRRWQRAQSRERSIHRHVRDLRALPRVQRRAARGTSRSSRARARPRRAPSAARRGTRRTRRRRRAEGARIAACSATLSKRYGPYAPYDFGTRNVRPMTKITIPTRSRNRTRKTCRADSMCASSLRRIERLQREQPSQPARAARRRQGAPARAPAARARRGAGASCVAGAAAPRASRGSGSGARSMRARPRPRRFAAAGAGGPRRSIANTLRNDEKVAAQICVTPVRQSHRGSARNVPQISYPRGTEVSWCVGRTHRGFLRGSRATRVRA